MDILDIAMAANKAVGVLENGGRVAKLTRATRQHTFSVSLEEMDGVEGAYGAIIEGTLGVKESDSEVNIFCTDIWGALFTVAKDIPVQSPLWAGNRCLVDPEAEDTNGSWLVVIDFDQNTSLIFGKTRASYEFTVVIGYDKITPIDPKFLPGVCLPVVEIADYTAITAEEGAKLDDAVTLGVPIVVKFLFDGIAISATLSCLVANGEATFSAYALLAENPFKLVLIKSDGWTMTISG